MDGKQIINVNLRSLFLNLQQQMISKLETNSNVIKNPGAKGAATELNWLDMLRIYLPKRYEGEKAFVLDANGNLSDEIDIVIFDRQYSPFLFKQDGNCYIPAESVYAVIEVKPSLSKRNIIYAGRKAASVRKLCRTSVPIPHAGGVFEPKKPSDILAGIVALNSHWKPPLGNDFENALIDLSTDERIDFGCILKAGSFVVAYGSESAPIIEKSLANDALIHFFLCLLERLQRIATVPALDIRKYASCLDELYPGE